MEQIKRKIENFWYHYKVQSIIALLVLGFLLLTRQQFMPEAKADCCVGIITPEYYTEEQLAGLQAAFEKQYGTVELNHYRVDLCETGQDDVMLSLLDADLVVGKSKIFLLASVEKFENATNGLGISEAVQVGDIAELAGLGFDGLWYVTRR